MKNKLLNTLVTVKPDQKTLAFCGKMLATVATIQYCMSPIMCAFNIGTIFANLIDFVFNNLLLVAGIICAGVGFLFLGKGLVAHDQSDFQKALGLLLAGALGIAANSAVAKLLGIGSLENLSFD